MPWALEALMDRTNSRNAQCARITLAFTVILLIVCGLAVRANARSVVLISIDGMRPDYVTHADQLGLKLPNLRRMMREGAYAEGVIGVVPTVTYPSHTSIITGVWPSRHGIYANTTFDPERKNLQGWYWYSEDIKVPTLWDATNAAGLSTASVSWPVSVGAPVKYLIPEVWRAGTPDDRKLVRALSTPGMLTKLEAELGPYADEGKVDLANDRLRAKFASAIIKQYKPNLMTVHLAAVDHEEHVHGPFSREANVALEASDEMIGQLRDAALSADPDAIICVVSDHGFALVTRRLNLVAAFVQAGLIQNPGTAKTPYGTPEIQSWEAMPWLAGGSAAIVLKDPQNQAVLKKTRELLRGLAADPQYGIARVVERDELAKLGGFPTASFLVDLKPGFQMDFSFSEPVVRESAPGGTHGYLPEHSEMRASFFLTGAGIAHGRNLGVIDMRQIAPTVAQLLGLSLPSADGKPLPAR
jgi:predicted AlkP superfamily pyrophosphatase or phosphodiesterase